MTTTFDVLRRPLVTEKTNYQVSKLHQYVFEVANTATRTQVKDAVESVFKVNVLRVNIINTAGKRTRRAKSRRLMLRDSGIKKAIVTLSPENSIPLFEGVE
jgi:large subunit ribosomal protein L23